MAGTLVIPSRQDVAEARRDLGAFGKLTGWPLETWQAEALSLRTRQTCLVSPRQCGKSRSLAVLACWWAFRRPNQVVLVISAGETAAGRLLRAVRDVAAHPLLHASVEDETKTWVVLSNGSQIRCVPASDAQVRGWSVDLLLCDEAAFISEDLLASAAIPTTAARPDARIVLASTPWGDSGMFWAMAQQGLEPNHPITATYQWKLSDAWWIVPEVIEAARATLSPLRFKAEYLGEWVGSGDSYFSRDDLLAAVCDFPMIRLGGGMPATAGLDWGFREDRQAVAVAGLLGDFGVNGRPVVVVPWVETCYRTYALQVAEVCALASAWDLTIWSETVGVGAAPTETLTQRLPRSHVIGVHTGQKSKEDAYGRVSTLLSERAIVFPQHEEMLRQLLGVSAQATPMGGLRIAARTESLHDDVPDAISLCVGGLPRNLAAIPLADVPPGVLWKETPGGLKVPVPVITIRAEESYAGLYGGITSCPACHLPYPSSKARCQWCQAGNPSAPPVVHVITDLPESVPNAWAPDLMRCPQGHAYLSAYSDLCPRCSGGGTRPAGTSMMPAAFSRALAIRGR